MIGLMLLLVGLLLGRVSIMLVGMFIMILYSGSD